jgi:hypothetical protein
MSKRAKGSGVWWLVVGGLVFAFFGLGLICFPTPYVSIGGTGAYANTPVTTVFVGTDSRVSGLLILAVAVFVWWFAYQVRKK